jgi:hypothetical protein
MGVSATAPIITAAFSQAMNPSTLTSSTFTLTAAGGAPVTGTVTYTATGSVATFAPSANLAYNTQYTATITTGAQSSAGAALAANYPWTFTTSAVPPTVLSVTPASAATGVAVTTTVTATFSQSMNPSTINSSTFTLAAAGGAAVTGTGCQHPVHGNHYHRSSKRGGNGSGCELYLELHHCRCKSEPGDSRFHRHSSDYPRIWRIDGLARTDARGRCQGSV